MKVYLGVGVILQVPDQAGAEVADIGLDLPDVVPEAVQFGDHDLIPVNLSVPMPARYQSPRHDDHQDSDGADDLGQPCQVLHLDLLVNPAADLVVFINLYDQCLNPDMGRHSGRDTSDRVAGAVNLMWDAPAD